MQLAPGTTLGTTLTRCGFSTSGAPVSHNTPVPIAAAVAMPNAMFASRAVAAHLDERVGMLHLGARHRRVWTQLERVVLLIICRLAEYRTGHHAGDARACGTDGDQRTRARLNVIRRLQGIARLRELAIRHQPFPSLNNVSASALCARAALPQMASTITANVTLIAVVDASRRCRSIRTPIISPVLG